MIDMREHTALIVGVTIAVLLISTVMVPVLDATTDVQNITYRNEYEHEYEQFTISDMAKNSEISMTMITSEMATASWPEGTLHPEYIENVTTNPDDSPTHIWSEVYLPGDTPPIIAYWGDGAVVDLGGSMGYVGFHIRSPGEMGFTELKDVNFKRTGSDDPWEETDLTIVVTGTGTTGDYYHLGNANFIIIPHRGGSMAICDPSEGPVYCDSGYGVSFGSSGTVAAISLQLINWMDGLSGVYGGWTDLADSGTSTHTMTLADSGTMDVRADIVNVGERTVRIDSLVTTVNGIPLDDGYVLAGKEYTVETGNDTVSSLVGIMPMMMLVAVMVPITDTLRTDDRVGRGRKKTKKEEER